jgi:hypothetical protein
VPSARSSGTAAAIFRREVLSSVRDLCFLSYRMNPAEDLVVVERSAGAAWLEVRPSSLA